MNYLALLRGVNVGGKGLIRMSELRECLEQAGFAEVRTYIQSGNVLFTAPKTEPGRLARKMEAAIEKRFAMKVGVVVFAESEWQEIVRGRPNRGERTRIASTIFWRCCREQRRPG